MGVHGVAVRVGNEAAPGDEAAVGPDIAGVQEAHQRDPAHHAHPRFEVEQELGQTSETVRPGELVLRVAAHGGRPAQAIAVLLRDQLHPRGDAAPGHRRRPGGGLDVADLDAPPQDPVPSRPGEELRSPHRRLAEIVVPAEGAARQLAQHRAVSAPARLEEIAAVIQLHPPAQEARLVGVAIELRVQAAGPGAGLVVHPVVGDREHHLVAHPAELAAHAEAHAQDILAVVERAGGIGDAVRGGLRLLQPRVVVDMEDIGLALPAGPEEGRQGHQRRGGGAVQHRLDAVREIQLGAVQESKAIARAEEAAGPPFPREAELRLAVDAHAPLQERVQAKRVGAPVRHPPEHQAPQGEPGEERRQDGRGGERGGPEHQGQHPHPNHFVHETARPRQEEEDDDGPAEDVVPGDRHHAIRVLSR